MAQGREKAPKPSITDVITSLEPEQLSSAKAHHYSRRKLGRMESALLWLLRIYVLFMMATVAYQVFGGAR
jgi:hypothetical protein